MLKLQGLATFTIDITNHDDMLEESINTGDSNKVSLTWDKSDVKKNIKVEEADLQDFSDVECLSLTSFSMLEVEPHTHELDDLSDSDEEGLWTEYQQDDWADDCISDPSDNIMLDFRDSTDHTKQTKLWHHDFGPNNNDDEEVEDEDVENEDEEMILD